MSDKYQAEAHAFNVQLAIEHGVDESILITHFQYWINHNKRLNRNLHDERTWMYQTVDEICAHFPYWSKRQVERIINSLVSKKILRKGNYNKHKMDRTVWYSFENEIKFTKPPNGDQEKTKRGSGEHQTVAPIPDTLTDTKKQQTEAAAVFACLLPLDISQEEKEWITRNHLETFVERAVEYVTHPSTTIKESLIQCLKWACKEQPKIKATATGSQAINKEYLASLPINDYQIIGLYQIQKSLTDIAFYKAEAHTLHKNYSLRETFLVSSPTFKEDVDRYIQMIRNV